MQINLTAQTGKYTNKPAHAGRQIWKWVSLVGVLVFFVTNIVSPGLIRGDEVDELENDLQNTRNQIQQYENQLNNTKAQIEEAKKKAASYAGALQSYSGQLAYAQAQLEQTQLELEQKKLELENTEVKVREATLSVQYHERVLKGVVRDFYKRSFSGNISFWFSNDTIGDTARTATYRARVSENFQGELLEIVGMLDQLLKQKDQLAVDKENFEKQQEDLNAQQAYLQRQITSVRANLATSQSQQQDLLGALTGLETQLGALSEKERQILQAKAAAALASTTVGETEISKSAIEKEAPSSGGPYFSFWTYGYPHRVGMNQYGAYGRSKAGQDYRTILQAYFSNVTVSSFWNDNDTIPVVGYGDLTMKDYLYGIGEMPESWGNSGGYEALKAQAVAARTYALNYIYYTWNGSSFVPKTPTPICTTQSCQVYTGNPKTGKWKQAVDETAGEVILYNGGPITAWYASTAGGFTLSSQEVWGGYRPWVAGIADLDGLSFPYDGPKWGNSPWYHKAWGNEPWLSGAQVADLFNAALLPEQYNSSLPADVFSVQDVRNTLQSHGITPVDSVQAVEVTGSNSKSSNLVRVYFNNGQSREVSAQRFRFVFNLRSPGTDAIWTSRFDVLSS